MAGDALGSLVEFRAPEGIRREYPGGVRDLVDGGTWGTIAGQPTDDSEMALTLARVLVEEGKYDPARAREAYIDWLKSAPFDRGITVSAGLRGRPKEESQSNGALMRISPLGILGSKYDPEQVAEWAKQDAALTHPHPVCQQVNALYTMAIAFAVKTGCGAEDLYKQMLIWAREINAEASVLDAVAGAAYTPPEDYTKQPGYVLTAFRNALWQLLRAPNFEDAVVDTVMRGGDTDTNAAICGALLGAVYGRDAVPSRWVECILQCRPAAGRPDVRHPRPERFWPVDALELAAQLVGVRNQA